MKNVVLIGMSGVGKSFIGQKLAEQIGFAFVDTDLQIEKKFGLKLNDVLMMLGEEAFLKEEANTIISLLGTKMTVIAPGGSIVYLEETIKMISAIGTIIYLKGDVDTILARIDHTNRGIIGLDNKTFQELYIERNLLYVRHAEYIISVDNRDTDTILDEIISILR